MFVKFIYINSAVSALKTLSTAKQTVDSHTWKIHETTLNPQEKRDL